MATPSTALSPRDIRRRNFLHQHVGPRLHQNHRHRQTGDCQSAAHFSKTLSPISSSWGSRRPRRRRSGGVKGNWRQLFFFRRSSSSFDKATSIPHDIMEDFESVEIRLDTSGYTSTEKLTLSVGPYGRVVRITGRLLKMEEASSSEEGHKELKVVDSKNFLVAFKVHGKIDTTHFHKEDSVPSALLCPATNVLSIQLPKDPSFGDSRIARPEFKEGHGEIVVTSTMSRDVVEHTLDEKSENDSEEEERDDGNNDTAEREDDARNRAEPMMELEEEEEEKNIAKPTFVAEEPTSPGRVFARAMIIPSHLRDQDFTVEHDCDGEVLRIACFRRGNGEKAFERAFRLPPQHDIDVDSINNDIAIRLDNGYLNVTLSSPKGARSKHAKQQAQRLGRAASSSSEDTAGNDDDDDDGHIQKQHWHRRYRLPVVIKSSPEKQ